MSTILKALKKIEGRKVDTRLPAWPYGTGDLEAADRYIRRSRQRQRILWLLIILCVAGLAGKIYIGSRSAADSKAPETTAAPNVAPPEKSDMTAAPATRITVEKAPESPPAKEAPSSTAPQAVAGAPPAEKTGSEAAAPKTVSPPAPEQVETAATKKASAPPPAETFATPPDDNDGLTLMALVWSEQPESRFVVINGNILRQGGSIENSTVSRIEGDYVVMKTGGITWKLK